MDSGEQQEFAAFARNTDPETSHNAANEITKDLPRYESQVLKSIKSGGLIGKTIAEVERDTGIPIQTCSPRLAPLRRKNHIIDSGA